MSTYEPKIQNVPYGLHIPYNQGYDARSRAKTPRAEDKGASGYLRRDSDGAQIDLWVTDLTADFSISGEVGQSQILREWFPHSFNDVMVTIAGNVASTQEFNRLAAFVREAHWNAVKAVSQNTTRTPTITFHLDDNTPAGWSKTARNVKGRHQPWDVSGYVKSMAAGAVAHEVAPSFAIQFIVTSTSQAMWNDSVAQMPVLKNILQLINVQKVSDRAQGPGFVTSQAFPAVATKVATKVAQTGWSVGVALKGLF